MNIDPKSGKPIIEISHSGLGTFASCPRKFAYRKVLTTGEQDRFSSVSASVGQAMHEGLQSYALHRDLDKAILAMAKGHPIDIERSDSAQYSLEACTTTLLHAVENELFDYELVYVDTPSGERKPGVEAKFLVEIDLGDECPVIFHLRGYIDLILRSTVSGRLMPVDIKTTTPQAQTFIEAKYQYDHQTTSYGLPLNALLGNFDKYDTGIFGVIMSDIEPQAALHSYTRTLGDIEDYQLYLLDKCSQIARYYMNGFFPRHPNACVAFNKLCPFHAHCHLRTMKEMQMRINPSMEPAPENPERPNEEPWIKLVIEGEMM